MTGERIKKLRKEKGLTQEQLGNLLGVKKSAIAKYENNRVENLKKDTIQKLSEIFDVPASYFLGIDESNQPIILIQLLFLYTVILVVELVFLLMTMLMNIYPYLKHYFHPVKNIFVNMPMVTA